MRQALGLTLTLALGVLLPMPAQAQVAQASFRYSDRNGSGTLIASYAVAGPDISLVQVDLQQNGLRLQGSGVQHSLGQGAYLLDFVLQDPRQGILWFYQGTGTGGFGNHASGTYFAVTSPQTTAQWQIDDTGANPPPNPTGAIVNSTPQLNHGWTRNSVPDPLGGISYFTNNTFQNTDSTATWAGSLPPDLQDYLVEVFIPVQSRSALKPRTNHATYFVSYGGTQPKVVTVNQQVPSSQWVSLGTFPFPGSYNIELVDGTSEPQQTHYVVAGAIRLTPQGNQGARP